MSEGTLHLGHSGRSRCELPMDIVTQPVAIVGRRGSGKTNTATVLVEGLLATNQQVVIVDPVGVWWGLKSSRDGRGQGHPIIVLGGAHGDLPLSEHDGAAIADLIVEEHLSCVLALDGLDTQAAERRFVTALADRLYQRKREARHRTALMVVFEEAGLVVPQRVGADEAKMVRAVQRLVRQGRAFGFGVTLIDQRPASVNKDVLTQTEVLIAHQVTSPHDRKALDAWVQAHDTEGHREEFIKSIASLKTGEAWVWSPAWLDIFARVQVRPRETFDSSATPKSGEAAVAPEAAASVDLNHLRSKLTQHVEQVKANDPKELRKRIAELERELAGKASAAPDPAVIEAVAMTAMQRRDEAWRERVRKFVAELREVREAHSEIGKRIAASVGELMDLPEVPCAKGAQNIPNQQALPPRLAPEPVRDRPEKSPTDPGLRPAHQRILDALAWLATVGITAPDRSIVAAIAGVSPRSSSFRNDVSRLSSLGLLRYPGSSQLMLAEEGHAAANHPEAPPTLQELHDAWRQSPALRPAHVRLLNPLLERYPGTLSREDLAGAAGVSVNSSSFRNDVSRLSSIGLVEYPSAGLVQASRQLLFPEGLR